MPKAKSRITPFEPTAQIVAMLEQFPLDPSKPPVSSDSARAYLHIGRSEMYRRIDAGTLIEPLQLAGRNYWLPDELALHLRGLAQKLDANGWKTLNAALLERRYAAGWMPPEPRENPALNKSKSKQTGVAATA